MTTYQPARHECPLDTDPKIRVAGSYNRSSPYISIA